MLNGPWVLPVPRPFIKGLSPKSRGLSLVVGGTGILTTGLSSARIASGDGGLRPMASARVPPWHCSCLPSRPEWNGRGRDLQLRRTGSRGKEEEERHSCDQHTGQPTRARTTAPDGTQWPQRLNSQAIVPGNIPHRDTKDTHLSADHRRLVFRPDPELTLLR